MVRKSARSAVFWVLAAAAILLAGRQLWVEWTTFRQSGASLTIDWAVLALSALLVLAAYGVLIETWRRVLKAWGSELRFVDAARIWFVSNLGRYLPGKIWQIAAMGAMAQERGVSAVAATGSAIVINLVNVVVGFGLVGLLSAGFFTQRWLAVLIAAAFALGASALPRMLPLAARAASQLLGKPIALPNLPQRAIWTAATGCFIAWGLYGVAFRVLVLGVLGHAPGETSQYIAAFTGSYLLGYIAVFAPGGLGVREAALAQALRRMELGIAGSAGVITLASRLWLTALELVPGLLFLAVAAVRRPHSPSSPRHDERP